MCRLTKRLTFACVVIDFIAKSKFYKVQKYRRLFRTLN